MLVPWASSRIDSSTHWLFALTSQHSGAPHSVTKQAVMLSVQGLKPVSPKVDSTLAVDVELELDVVPEARLVLVVA